MISTRSILRLSLTAACLFLLPLHGTDAQANPVVDQQNLGPVTGNVGILPNLTRGQSFTVGIEGLLAGFEFHFNKSSVRATGNAYLSIYTTDGVGAPDSLLGQAFLPAASVSNVSSFHYFDLTPLGIDVAVGDLMFAALSADFNGGTFATNNVYAGGSEWGCAPDFMVVCWTAADNNIADLVFSSHVVPVSAPAPLAVMALGILALASARRTFRG